MDELEKQQAAMERIGLMAASLYSGMVRECVPAEVAERMTTQIVSQLLRTGQEEKRAQARQPSTLMGLGND